MDQRIYNKYITEVLANGSLTNAAHALGISQPALSNGITSLEKELGFKIFNRRTIPVSLTPEGELYYDYIKRQQILEQDFFVRIEEFHSQKNQHVIIGTPSAYVDTIIADAVYNLLNSNPSYSATIKEAPLDTLIHLASQREIHCFLSTSENIPENFEKKLIYYENLCLGIPKNMFSSEYELTSSDFNFKDFIYLEDWQPLQLEMNKYFEQYGITPKKKIKVSQVATAISLAQKGLGICFASEASLKNVDLRVYPLPIKSRPIYIAYDKELFMPASGVELIEILSNYGGF